MKGKSGNRLFFTAKSPGRTSDTASFFVFFLLLTTTVACSRAASVLESIISSKAFFEGNSNSERSFCRCRFARQPLFARGLLVFAVAAVFYTPSAHIQ